MAGTSIREPGLMKSHGFTGVDRDLLRSDLKVGSGYRETKSWNGSVAERDIEGHPPDDAIFVGNGQSMANAHCMPG
jgi:hypothetical protein